MTSGPLRIVHPASDESLSVDALRAAIGEAGHRDEGDWIALLQTGYRAPKLEPGEQVDLDDIAVLIEYVSQRAERAATIAVDMHEDLVAEGVAEARPRKDIVGGHAGFITGARRWVDTARRAGGPAVVEVGAPTIDDPSLPSGAAARLVLAKTASEPRHRLAQCPIPQDAGKHRSTRPATPVGRPRAPAACTTNASAAVVATLHAMARKPVRRSVEELQATPDEAPTRTPDDAPIVHPYRHRELRVNTARPSATVT